MSSSKYKWKQFDWRLFVVRFEIMKKTLKYLKNKYVLATSIFVVYSLFLDENDLFSLISQNRKLKVLQEEKLEMDNQLNEVNATLNKLKYTSEVERFAREKKLFKKDGEDVFVISYE